MRVEVSAHIIAFPHECACCGAVPDAELAVSAGISRGKRVVHTETKLWNVPYCSRCLSHIRSYEQAASIAKWLTVFSIVTGLVIGLAWGAFDGIAVGILSIILTIAVFSAFMKRARSICCADCTDVDSVVTYIGWQSSVHKFEIKAQRYASKFMVANSKKLVNLSPAALNLLSAKVPKIEPDKPRAPLRYIS